MAGAIKALTVMKCVSKEAIGQDLWAVSFQSDNTSASMPQIDVTMTTLLAAGFEVGELYDFDLTFTSMGQKP